ncbi:MAG: GAF domain-containing protein [Opitutaceae bacterium]
MKRIREALRIQQVESFRSDYILRLVCTDLAKSIQADLVSIWYFNKAQTEIRCQIYYDSHLQSFKRGQILYRKDFPHYFQAIIEETCIAAVDAQRQMATRELSEAYLIPNGIQSILDFILHQDSVPVGVICCECRDTRRDWTDTEKGKLRVIAELLSHRFHFDLAESA